MLIHVDANLNYFCHIITIIKSNLVPHETLPTVSMLRLTFCMSQRFCYKIVTSEAISLKFVECDTDKWEQVHCKSCSARVKITKTTECQSKKLVLTNHAFWPHFCSECVSKI